MKNRRNYYRILHVQHDAPKAVIQASYRAIMQRLKMHPDLGGDHLQASLINEAAATLCDPVRRAAYDLARAQSEQQRREPFSSGPAPRAPVAPPRPPASRKANVPCAFCGAPCSTAELDDPASACASCGSALFPARKHQTGDASRRAIERLPRSMPLTFRLATAPQKLGSGTTEDLSLNGMRILLQAAIAVGERLQIECDFCSAVGIVKRVSPGTGSNRGRWHCGVEFLALRVKNERGGLFSTLA